MTDRQNAQISSRKRPKQARSADLVAAILEAAAQVLAKEGALICSPKIGPFGARVFRGIFPWLGGVEDDESLEVFGRPKGVHSPAGR